MNTVNQLCFFLIIQCWAEVPLLTPWSPKLQLTPKREILFYPKAGAVARPRLHEHTNHPFWAEGAHKEKPGSKNRIHPSYIPQSFSVYQFSIFIFHNKCHTGKEGPECMRNIVLLRFDKIHNVKPIDIPAAQMSIDGTKKFKFLF